MAKKNKLCDFCLNEEKGLFKQPDALPDGHHVCKKCRQVIESYGLPVRYDLMQILVTAEPGMCDMIMGDYLESHTAADAMAKFFPLPQILLHDGEHCINQVPAAITVTKAMIPETDAVKTVYDIQRSSILNLNDAVAGSGETVKGKLILTDAALYFLSDHFINCHRPTAVIRDQEHQNAVTVSERGKVYTYTLEHPDLFFLRERFFRKVQAAKQNKKDNLIYISNDSDIAITPGTYRIPKHIQPGAYQITVIKDGGLSLIDRHGKAHTYIGNDEPIVLEVGCVLECSGEYRLTPIRK